MALYRAQVQLSTTNYADNLSTTNYADNLSTANYADNRIKA